MSSGIGLCQVICDFGFKFVRLSPGRLCQAGVDYVRLYVTLGWIDFVRDVKLS